MLRRVGRIALPAPIHACMVIVLPILVLLFLVDVIPPPKQMHNIQVAHIGNSMQYYNDFPRFLQTLSNGAIAYQNSCLHGNANLESILTSGNGMYRIWRTGSARIYTTNEDATLHDFGACSVRQLLFGYDYDLDVRVHGDGDNGDGVGEYTYFDDDNDDNVERNNNDDFATFTDGKNPCFYNPYYYDYVQQVYAKQAQLSRKNTKVASSDYIAWDFLIVNDNTRAPARLTPRQNGLQVLQDVYVPMLLELPSQPTLVFLATYGYDTPYRDMTGLVDPSNGNIANFTSLTHQGYVEYAKLVQDLLGPDYANPPRIAPVGIAFLTVYEENYSLWKQLFHVDKIHASPIGTYLQGLVVHHTLFGKMPTPDIAFGSTGDHDDYGDIARLYQSVRKFQPGAHRRTPFPTVPQAKYLYNVALRVCKHGYRPTSFVDYSQRRYKNVEMAAEYTPNDDIYSVDDLF